VVDIDPNAPKFVNSELDTAARTEKVVHSTRHRPECRLNVDHAYDTYPARNPARVVARYSSSAVNRSKAERYQDGTRAAVRRIFRQEANRSSNVACRLREGEVQGFRARLSAFRVDV
jgi:hypothetical protein